MFHQPKEKGARKYVSDWEKEGGCLGEERSKLKKGGEDKWEF